MCVCVIRQMELNSRPFCQHSLVDIKDPTVSFTKGRQAITGTMAKFQIPAKTSRELNQSTAEAQPRPQPMMPPHGLVLHTNEEEDHIIGHFTCLSENR